MSDAETETGMDEVIKCELCKDEYGVNKLLPHYTIGKTEIKCGYHLKGLLNFCKLIGDATSMIILSKSVKVRVHPHINPHAIANCVECKIGRKGTALCDMDGNLVHDINNKSMLCVGDWKATINYEQF